MRKLGFRQRFFILTFSFSLLSGLFYCALAGYVNNDIWDDRTSFHKSGVKTPREYYEPPTATFEKVDFQEFRDYHKTHYSPYAQLQIPYPLQIGRVDIQEGYYLVKLDMIPAPPPPPKGDTAPVDSMAQSVHPENEKPKSKSLWSLLKSADENDPPYSKRKNFPTMTPNDPNADSAPRLSLLVKREGEIELVIPVYSSQIAEKGMKKGSTARLVIENSSPVRPQVLFLQYCVKKICYKSAPLEPGLVQ